MADPIEIFFSYAHEDEDLMNGVRRQLALFERRKEIKKWHDRQILPGSPWEGQIDQRLKRSQIVLLFVSPHFLDSDYAYDVEMTEAIRRHDAGEARVIPIIVRPCPWEAAPFSKLQVLPKNGDAITLAENQDLACLGVAQGIMSVVAELNDRATKQDQSHRIAEGASEIISVNLATLVTSQQLRISVTLSAVLESDNKHFYVVNFVLMEKTGDEFQDRVRVNVRLSGTNDKKAKKVMVEGWATTHLQFLKGPVLHQAKNLPFGTFDDKELDELIEQMFKLN